MDLEIYIFLIDFFFHYVVHVYEGVRKVRGLSQSNLTDMSEIIETRILLIT